MRLRSILPLRGNLSSVNQWLNPLFCLNCVALWGADCWSIENILNAWWCNIVFILSTRKNGTTCMCPAFSMSEFPPLPPSTRLPVKVSIIGASLN